MGNIGGIYGEHFFSYQSQLAELSLNLFEDSGGKNPGTSQASK